MPVRLRIALLFTILVCVILLIVGNVVYYISYQGRLDAVQTRLTLRANNIVSFFKQAEAANGELIQKIDNWTAAPLRDKEIQVFDNNNMRVYVYSDRRRDTLLVFDTVLLNKARQQGNIYYSNTRKEAVGIYDRESDIVVFSATSDEQGKHQLFQLKMTLTLSLVGGAFIALVGGYLFAGRLLRPVKEIADEVNEISGKNLTQRIPTGTTKDEWHYLSSTLNRLMDRLQKTLDMHRRFITNASHELSTPLAAISNQLGIVLQKKRKAEEYHDVMTFVYRDTLHLSKLTRTLLEFAQTSGNDSGLEIQPVRIDEVLLQLPAEMVRINRDYIVLLEFDNLPLEEDGLLVFGNEELLLTAVKNIVLNACKYTIDHKALVRLTAGRGEVNVEIIDNGPGIPEKELGSIFQPFYRGHVAGAIPGFGLGLSLTRRIIKLHKGQISVESSVKKGTIFTIHLPAGFQQNGAGANGTYLEIDE
ncbi:MAG: HAMP domain-containing histidine kinase [Niastella sp.]|nr:HAMP domain-containing histidine kinase [Niastella sp.]